MRFVPLFAAALLLVSSSSSTRAAQGPAKPLLNPSAGGIQKRVKTSPQVSVAQAPEGLAVTVAPGNDGYPGITLTPPDGAPTWDLSAYGRLEARVRNTSDKPLGITLRVDDDGDWKTNPWNAENTTVPPGKSATVKLIFGHSYGFKPAHKLASARVARVLLFVGKTDARRTFVVESVVAAGEAGEKPPVDPESIRVVPADGLIVGAGMHVDVAKQLKAPDGGAATAESGGAIRLTFPKAGKDLYASVKPAVGRWNLRQWLAARVRVRNAGPVALTPKVRLESGSRGDVVTGAPIAPGGVAEIVVPFAPAHVWDGGRKEAHAGRFASNAASAVTIGVAKGDGQRVLVVEEVRAILPPAEPLPDWLGKRPPVTDGQWVQTFDDEFDGDAVDTAKWSFYGENYWDNQTTHFARANTVVGGGVVRLRVSKQRGHHNDDPKRFQSDYATGFLQTRGKWTQRYGYFESRMKLPTAPGLWPAFWMMPNRGPGGAGGGTDDGGMEFDVMEHLTRWGVNRYNIAMHWDGYRKNHKSIGTDAVYCRPDEDGFVTAGLLWLPGKAVYYCNGREVARWENPRVASVPAEMMFTLPVGGWDNDWVDDAKLPDDFVIDYVRVWQRADLK